MSCDGPGLAEAFGNRLKLKDCTISYIGSNADMPKWGQLGCSGFIVLDQSHSVVCKATSAYMQMGEGPAFNHVETLLTAMLDGKGAGGVAAPVPVVVAGQMVTIHGLQSQPQLNPEVVLR